MSKVVHEKMSVGQWVNPSRPTNVQQTVKILNVQYYASFDSLCRLLGVNDDASKDAFYEELQNECASACPSVGEVDCDSATTALLETRKVFYSKTWAAAVSWPQGIGMKIGYHLYRRILDNHWNDYGAKGGLRFAHLDENNFDRIIERPPNIWHLFAGMYAIFDAYDELCEKCHVAMDKIQEAQKRLQELDLEVFMPQKEKKHLRKELELQKREAIQELEGNMGFPLARYWIGSLWDAHGDDGIAQVHYDAASQGIVNFIGHAGGEAELVIAEMYYHGRGREVDREQAREWFKKAQELGNTAAGQMLQQLEF